MRNHKQSCLDSIKNSGNQYPIKKSNNSSINTCNSNTTAFNQAKKDYLVYLLLDLDGVNQDPYYHPEIDTLYHSLQVFQLANQQTDDHIMLAAALFHDIGKAIDMHEHATIGAEMLRGLLVEPIPWLVKHHLDLLIHPKQTRKRLRNTLRLKQLEQLRRWDIQGRETDIDVITPIQAIQILTQADEIFQLNP